MTSATESRDWLATYETFVATRALSSIASPPAALDRYEHFVRAVEQGYDDNIYEYEFDRAIRDSLGDVLAEDALSRDPAGAWFVNQMSILDARLQSALSDVSVVGGETRWWRAHMPKVAGQELADDLTALYGYTPVVTGSESHASP